MRARAKPKLLPFENATSGKRAINDLQKALEGLGASAFGYMQDYDHDDLIVQFRWRDQSVSIRANARGYAAMWLQRHPYRPRMQVTQEEYERRALERGRMAIFSSLRDALKGQITAIETGLWPFQYAFLPFLVLPSGETVMERLQQTNMLNLPGPPPPR